MMRWTACWLVALLAGACVRTSPEPLLDPPDGGGEPDAADDTPIDGDGDGVLPPEDCDDGNPDIPGYDAPDDCACMDDDANGIDEDCNGVPDDGGTGVAVSCDRDEDGVNNDIDCAPDDARIHPGASDPTVSCSESGANGIDEDCSGVPDDQLVDDECEPLPCRGDSWAHVCSPPSCVEDGVPVLLSDGTCVCGPPCGDGGACPAGSECHSVQWDPGGQLLCTSVCLPPALGLCRSCF